MIVFIQNKTKSVIDKMKTPVSETELIQRIFESDPEAIEILYDKYSPLLYTFIKKIVKDEKITENVIQEIFGILLKRIIYYDFNSRNPYTWLITLARNISLFELGRSRESKEVDLKDKQIVPKLSHLIEPYDLEQAFNEKDKIENALNSLTDAQQYVIYLSFYEGLTQKQISEKLKIPLTTVESKIKISMLNLNENFIGKSTHFVVKNETVEMIYPFALGCLEKEEKLKLYERFKTVEPFPWKLLGQYQKLVSLLPILLDFELPPVGLKEKIINQLFKAIKEKKTASADIGDKRKSFEPVTSATSQLKLNKEESVDENNQKNKYKRIEKLEESKKEDSQTEKKKTGYEPVVPLKSRIEENIAAQKFNYKKKRRNYTGIILIVLILIFIGAAISAYLFYTDKASLYETEIDRLTQQVEDLVREKSNRPEIPGLGELSNPRFVELSSSYETISSGKIIYSSVDKRGYLHIQHLPILEARSAYQLWGNFNGTFVSLGVFKVSSRPDYYPFTLPEFIEGDLTEFYVIESNAEGSRRPGSKVYLKGKV